MKLIFR